jgi:putative transposase
VRGSPNLNCYAERWVRSVKSECLSKLILFGESSLRRALTNFCQHYHARKDQLDLQNLILWIPRAAWGSGGAVHSSHEYWRL